MAGRDVVGEAVLLLELDDHASAEMAKAVAEFRAEAAALGREKAEIKVKADTDEAKRKLAELKAEEKALTAQEKELQKQRDASDKQQRSALTRQLNGKRQELAATRDQVKATDAEVAALRRKGQVAQSVNKAATQLEREHAKAIKETEKAVKEEQKAEQERAKAIQKAKDDTLKAVRAEQKAQADAAKARDAQARTEAQNAAAKARADAAEASRSERLAKLSEQQLAARRAETAKLAETERTAGLNRAKGLEHEINLQSRYTAASKRFDDLSKAYNRAQGSDKVRVEVDGARALAEMVRLKEELRLIGREPIKQKVEVDQSALRRIGSGLGNAFGFNKQNQLTGLAAGLNDVAKAAKSAKINIGPMSLSVHSFLIASSALAPVITGLVGTLGALVSAVGAGAVGALGSGAAAAAGFGLATIGMATALKPYVQGVIQAHKYTLAYQAAVAKYGADSKQAQKAQQVMNNQMSTVPKVSRQAAQGIAQITGEWKHLTAGAAQRSFGNIVGSSLKTVSTLLPQFAKDTNTALGAVSRGWQGWMTQLRSPGAQAAIHNIFSNFNQSIPSIMTGLGSLGTAFGRVISAFSGHLPTLASGFASWARNIANATGNSGHLHAVVSQLVNAMQSLGHFAQSSGRFLISFFKAGIGPGVGLVNDMTRGLNRLTTQMNTTAGQTKLHDFFSRSIDTTKQLWSALKPLGSAFLTLSRALAPVSAVVLKLVELFAKLAGAVLGFKPLQFAAGFAIAAAVIGRMTSGLREGVSLIRTFGSGLVSAFSSWRAMGGGLSNIGGALKGAFGGAGAGGALETALTTGGAAAASEIAAAFTAGAAEVAAAIEGSMATGGVTAAAEASGAAAVAGRTAGGVLLPASAVAGSASGIAAEGAAASTAAPEVAALEAASIGLGGALALLAAPFAAAGALALVFGGHVSNAQKATEALKQSAAGLKTGLNAAKNLSGGYSGITATAPALPGDRKQVNALQAEYNKLTAEGKTNTQQFRDVQSQLNSALVQRQNDQQTVNDGLKVARTNHQAVARVIDGSLRKAYTGLSDAQKDVTNAQKDYNRAQQMTGPKSYGAQARAAQELAQANQRYAKTQAEVNKQVDAAHAVQYRLVTDTLNQQRAMVGNIPVADQYAVSVGRLKTQIDQYSSGAARTKALNLLVKTPDPSQLAKLGNQINSLSGGSKTKAINVVANSANAQQAIDRINNTIIKPKILNLRTNVGDVLAKIASVEGRKLTPKQLRIVHSGDAEAIAKIIQMNGIRVPAKVLRILGDLAQAQAAHNTVASYNDIRKLFQFLGDASGALSAWSAVNSTVHNISASVILTAQQIVTRVFRVSGNPNPPPATQYIAKPGGASHPASNAGHGFVKALGGPGNVASGLSNDPVVRSKQFKAAAETIHTKPQVIQAGGMYEKPTLLVGEEHRREYVIATNPAYRKHNVGWLAAAAKEFGYKLETAATGRAARRRGPKPGTSPTATQGKNLRHAFKNSVYDLPVQDRIGGVGTADIDDAVSNAQSAYQDYHQRINSHTDKKGHHVGPKNSEKARDQANWNKLQQLKGLSASAKQYIQTFQNVETDIATIGKYMDYANASKDGHFKGINPLTGRVVNGDWGYWQSQDLTLQNRHVTLLQKAADDARKKVGKNRNAINIGYVKTLENALGAAIVDRQTVGAETYSPSTANAYTTPSLDDLMKLMGVLPQYQQLQFLYSQAQSDNVADLPGTSGREDLASLANDRDTAYNLMNFLGGPTGAGGIIAKVANNPDFALRTEVQDAFNQARSTYTGILDTFTQAATASGPGQAQIFDTARSNLLQQYGSNAVLRAMGGPVDPSAAMLGALSQPNLTMAATGSPANPSGGGDTNVTVHNTFATAPEDPHTWSAGLSWELQHTI